MMTKTRSQASVQHFIRLEEAGDHRPCEKGPWLRHSSQPVYENPWISLRHEEVTTPTGTSGIYGKLHFKHVAVGVIPVDAEGYTWLVKQYRYALEQDSWEIPEGGCPEAEDGLEQEGLLECAKRELKEETGLSADKWTELLRLHTSNSVTDEWAVIYIAENLTEGDPEPDEFEELEIRRLPLQQAIDMAMSGEITDAMSLAGLFKLALMQADR